MERREAGSALPLMVLAVVLAGVLAMALGRMGGAARARAQAQTAADAAALAGAADGEPAARALAEANGGHIVAYEEDGNDTRVQVEVGPARATGRARREAAAGSPAAEPPRVREAGPGG